MSNQINRLTSVHILLLLLLVAVRGAYAEGPAFSGSPPPKGYPAKKVKPLTIKNPAKQCVGFVETQAVLTHGTGNCVAASIEVLTQQVQDCFLDPSKCPVCGSVNDGGVVRPITDSSVISRLNEALTEKYKQCLVEHPEIKDGGVCLGSDVDPNTIAPGECVAVAAVGTRCLADGSEGPSTHAFMLCKDLGGKLYVADNNDPSGVFPATYENSVLCYSCHYNKPPKAVGESKQTYNEIVDLHEILKTLNKR